MAEKEAVKKKVKVSKNNQFGFVDSVKFVIENANYPTWEDVKNLFIDVSKMTFLLGFTNLILYLVFHSL